MKASHRRLEIPISLAEIKSTIEFAQTHANKIISSNLPTEETIKKLSEELSNEFYIARFITSFKSFQSIYQANQEQRADIEARFTQLESHCPRCEELKSLISEWRIELDKLQSNTFQDHTLDNTSELSEQLGKFKDKLE
ncbi:hypothetical protein [Rickettsiella massiliensis]|uniref:hypothetical protein n=1 Tax=Rickettsiella massiliensis TaxID=676517 RepID=UPI00029A53DA|nr:hypothetical protein [Rickettsiella massiliensis]